MSKTRMLARIGCGCVCLWMATSALADPIGVIVEDETVQPQGLAVCKVYAAFDYYADELLGIAFSDIETDDPAGFYQHAQGGDTAPDASQCGTYPGLCLDSYVTIGVEDSSGGDDTALSPDWNSSRFNNQGKAVGDWYNSNPDNTQGEAGEEHRVLVGQFTRTPGYSVTGDISVFFDNGMVEYPMSFLCPGLGGGGQSMGFLGGEAGTCFVDDDGEVDNDCSSWQTACSELQTALAKAELGECDEIWVAEGTYFPDFDVNQEQHTGDRLLSFAIPSGVNVYGGFLGTEQELNPQGSFDATILSGEIGSPGSSDNTFHVVDISGANSVLLDGFKITGGNASGSSVPSGNGGGLLGSSVGGGVQIRNCTFEANQSACTGGGAAISSGADVTIRDCKFVSNLSETGAGGLRLAASGEVVDCVFMGNTVETGGALTGLGGGLVATGDVLVEGSRFKANEALEGGGAAIRFGVRFLSDFFFDNVAGAGGKGSAIFRICTGPPITNCLFVGNNSTALDSTDDCTVLPNVTELECDLTADMCDQLCFAVLNFEIANCNFLDNETAIKATSGVDVDGSIMRGNTANIELAVGANCTVGFCNIEGGLNGIPGACDDDGDIIDMDPDFIDPVNENYRLMSGSPVIDYGDNTSPGLVGVISDPDGFTLRFVDEPSVPFEFDPGVVSEEHPEDIADMGAYEFQACQDCEADFNLDGVVDIVDLLQLIGNWGDCPEEADLADPSSCPCRWDFEPIVGEVDIQDLLGVIAAWGDCPE